jgi:hypothetical protein
MHIHLKASYDTKVPVQVFYSHFFNTSDQACYLIGIREMQDSWPQLPDANGEPLADLPFTAAATDSSNGGSHSLSVGSLSNDSVLHLPQDAEEPAILIDLLSSELDIVQASGGFAALGGPSSEGAPFLQWVPSEERHGIRSWTQKAANRWFNSAESCPSQTAVQVGTGQSEPRSVNFKPPGIAGAIEFRAKATLFMEAPAQDADPGHLIAKMVFCSIKQHRQKRERRHGNSSRSRLSHTVQSI